MEKNKNDKGYQDDSRSNERSSKDDKKVSTPSKTGIKGNDKDERGMDTKGTKRTGDTDKGTTGKKGSM